MAALLRYDWVVPFTRHYDPVDRCNHALKASGDAAVILAFVLIMRTYLSEAGRMPMYKK